jgi:hypothetical protein
MVVVVDQAVVPEQTSEVLVVRVAVADLAVMAQMLVHSPQAARDLRAIVDLTARLEPVAVQPTTGLHHKEN